MDAERRNSLLEFLIIADQMKSIERRTYVGGSGRRENDAEHCWHMALCALVLHREVGLEADLGRTLSLVLVHDLVEIYAGDTYAYDDAALVGQAERERKAADRLFGTLPPDIGGHLRALWDEFEAGETPESKLARACDRMQGFLQNFIAEGRSWREHGVTPERTKVRMQPAYDADPVFGALLDELYDRADRRGYFG
jgi:Predicted hydrolases of HD superfamily